MSQKTKPHLPIGYWLKQADNLITEQVNKVQAVYSLSRSDWQVLNALFEAGPISRECILELMSTFISSSDLDEIISQLIKRGWAESLKNAKNGMMTFQLTHEGSRNHSIILAVQKEARERSMKGISEEEYTTTVRVLQQIVNNLNGDTEPL